ncbi:MAG TPA: M15 family metallopeptidase [Miltoncostaea sp.]|nr:M15 family metallopeptidase [Miltoncostaea sp.]
MRRLLAPALAGAALALAPAVAAEAAEPPPFRAVVRALSPQERSDMTPSVWRRGCPVALSQLRHVSLPYIGFGGRPRRGALVVNASATADVVAAFRDLYRARFPIRRMRPVQAYGGDDYRSIEADNTSAFNCRPATGSSNWSNHAYGLAIDLNPLENPYVSGGRTSHRRSVPYLVRSPYRKGMIVEGGVVTRAFDARGWGWGGRWSGPTDYQHLSVNGR